MAGEIGQYQRARGCAEVSFSQGRLKRLYQSGSAKAMLPRVSGDPEVVLLNTAGGLTDGDAFDYALSVEGGSLRATTQTAERAYRSLGQPAHVTMRIRVGAEAKVFWMPQETILFDGANLSRRLDVDLAEGAGVLLSEMVVLGRGAMGETRPEASFADHWRVRRNGKLVHAEATGFSPPVPYDRPAALAGARAFATLVHIAPDAEGRLADMRRLLADGPLLATALPGKLILRGLSEDPATLRASLSLAIRALAGEVPRVWP